MPSTRLRGIKHIKKYTEHGWDTILDWIENDGFPAKLINKRWTSDKELIDKWFRRRIEASEDPS